MTDGILRLSGLVRDCGNIVFFGGAGVSTESGIPDFRSESGIYRRDASLSPEHLLSHRCFTDETEVFYDYYKKNLVFPDKKPNRAHYALAALEKCGKLRAVVTQNIDGLHQDAGSANVIELHGTAKRNYCTVCRREYPLSFVLEAAGVPLCPVCGAPVRPDVVLYDEALDGRMVDAAIRCISEAELLIIGGTSLAVYPAAGFIRYFHGRELVIINKTPTKFDASASLVLRGSIGETLGGVCDNLGI
ncbi:MAG: NAD-dependent protein deacylase [Eubacteriales bacterium]